ncbi:hypothetical protein GGI07_002991 [Coemansia sp. Benny D115]|nr:hypothetical protein GGI07_002991 [Coemansia sp. Benny D115]
MDITLRASIFIFVFFFQFAGGNVISSSASNDSNNSTHALSLSKRVSSSDPLSFDNYRGAVLVVNGLQTSCEFALIDTASAFVAATCFTDTAGNIIKSNKYEIYFNNALDKKSAKTTIKPEQITIHPKFDLKTFANNIAVVTFDAAAGTDWSSSIRISMTSENSRRWVRRTMASVTDMTWDIPLSDTKWSMSSYCEGASGIYAANVGDMLCTKATLPAALGAKCSIPYSLAYGVVGNTMAPVAVYSHSVFYGANSCDATRRLHYYTMVSNFITFAEGVTGRQIAVLPNTHDVGFSKDAKYKMKAASFNLVDGTGTITGNFFDVQGDSGQPIIVDTNTGGSSGSGSGSESNNSNGNGSGTGSNANPGSNSGNQAGTGSDSGSNAGGTNGNSNGSGSGSTTSDSSNNGNSASNGSNGSNGGNGGNGNNNNNDNNNGGDSGDNGSDNSVKASKTERLFFDEPESFAPEYTGDDDEYYQEIQVGAKTVTETISGKATVMVLTSTYVVGSGSKATPGSKDSGDKTDSVGSNGSSGSGHANCFDFVSGRQIDESVIYSVHLDDGASDQPMFSVDIAAPDVHIHPDYDPSTFANNIAVVIFYDMPNDPYTSYIVNDSFDSSDLLYVSRLKLVNNFVSLVYKSVSK